MTEADRNRVERVAGHVCQYAMDISGFVDINGQWEGDHYVLSGDYDGGDPASDLVETAAIICEILGGGWDYANSKSYATGETKTYIFHN